MLQYVLRCSRMPNRAGKVIRHAMRHHWGLSHRAARRVYHGAIAGTLVCVAVPIVIPWLPSIPAMPPPETIAQPIPEPSSILPLAVGVVALLLLRRILVNRAAAARPRSRSPG